VIKTSLSGVAAAALLTPSVFALVAFTTPAHAAPAAVSRGEPPAWIIVPGVDSCRTELELAGRSGAVAPAALVSNGEDVDLVFTKADAPERAFLPIRIDHRAFPNLVLRQADGKSAAMRLSAETLAALKKGGALQIGWLGDEPVQVGLAGSDQALSDLRTCGAQVADRYRTQQAAQREAQARSEADARTQALADEQLAAAKAQKAAAEAEAERNAAEAAQLQATADAERQRAQAAADAARERAQQQAQAESYPYARANDDPDEGRGGYYPPDPYNRYEPPSPYRRW
jgi:chemotaxis protein histidine kinase CheA